MIATSNKTITYVYDDEYMIDIVTTRTTFESWLYHKDYCAKMFLWGCPKDQQSYFEYMQLVKENIPDYIEDYQREFED